MRSRFASSAIVLLVATIAFAASFDVSPAHPTDSQTQQQPTRRISDSAGISIVEFTNLGTLQPAFTLSSDPLFTIGKRSDEAHQFYRNSIDVTRLSNGHIVMSTHLGTALHFFDETGAYVRTVGSSGDGTGQFGAIEQICRLRGDSLLIADQNRSFSLFDATGKFVRSTPRAFSGNYAEWLFCSPDGTLFMTAPSATGQPGGAAPDPLLHFKLGVMVNAPHTVLILPQQEPSIRIVTPEPGRPTRILSLSRPFARAVSVAPDSEMVHIANGPQLEVRTYAVDGRPLRILRVKTPLEPVTPALRAAYIAEQLAPLGEPARPKRDTALHAPGVFPDSVAAFRSIMIDGARRLWVQRHPLPGEPQQWLVFDQNAQLLGAVTIPRKLIVTEIPGDVILSRVALSDSLGPFYQLQVHRLAAVRRN